MTSRWVVFLALGFAALSGAPAAAQSRGPMHGDEEAAKHGWLFDLEEGKARAHKSGKPLLVVIRCVP